MTDASLLPNAGFILKKETDLLARMSFTNLL
jgi:hypothetical protein